MVRGRRKRGITLVELLAAAVILGFVAPAILGAQAAAYAGAATLPRRARALALAQGTLEFARSLCEAGTIGTGSSSGTSVEMGTTFTTQTAVTNPSYDLALVEVRTSWPERRNGRDITEEVRLAVMKRTRAFP